MAATTLSTWLAPADHGHPPASAPMAQKQQHHDDEAQDRDPVSPPESPLKPLAKDRSDNTFGKELAIASLSLEDDDESFPGKPSALARIRPLLGGTAVPLQHCLCVARLANTLARA
jgi:hypothetical protein